MNTHSIKTNPTKDIKLYNYRLEHVRLIWVKQILDLIEKFKIKSVNDLGCNYFQLYKEIKIRKKKINYYGYDSEIEFLKIGLKKFPELKKRFKICNIENTNIRRVDCSIISSTLEHLDFPYKALKRIIKSTRKIILIRSCFGPKEEKLIGKVGFKHPVNYNQFSFIKFKKYLEKFKFQAFYILDDATSLSSKAKIINKKYKRKTYICFAIKN